MKGSFHWAMALLWLTSCQLNPTRPGQRAQSPNLLVSFSKSDLQGWQWMNTPASYQLKDGKLRVKAMEGTDFFNNPEDSSITASAPFLYREIQGDFTATLRLKPDFSDVWNAGALMMYADSTHWIKFAFENSDATGPGIVSVVTRDFSDDANGAVLNEEESIWLRLVRKGDLYALHWSRDGEKYFMARLSRMPPFEWVKVGLEAQSPVGEPAIHEFTYLNLTDSVPENLRTLHDFH
jgi:hypothetical protein